MIQIRRIKPDEWPAAKQLVYRVAHAVFNDTRTLEESTAYGESNGWLKDMNNIQETYFDNDGIFLVMINDDQLIDAMIAHPILIERPLVVTAKGVRLCRPSEAVIDLLPPQRGAFAKEDGTPLIDAKGQVINQK